MVFFGWSKLMIGNNSFIFIYVLMITILVPSIMFLSFLFLILYGWPHVYLFKRNPQI